MYALRSGHGGGCKREKQTFGVPLQVKRELIAMHVLNFACGRGCQRTYGALMDNDSLFVLCYDAGDDWTSWDGRNLKDLAGKFTHSRYATCDFRTSLH